MIDVRIEEKPAFTIVGCKRWMGGPDNEQFDVFWREARESGLVDRLRALAQPGALGAGVFGASCVEADPEDRSFFFFIAAEGGPAEGLETHSVPACAWAVFSNRGPLPDALVEAEMHAFMTWLPASPYVHAHAPELEVYPGGDAVEFWLPIAGREHP